MTELRLVDSELRDVLAKLPTFALDAATLPAVRRLFRDQFPGELGARAGVTVSRMEVPGLGSAPEVGILMYQPTSAEAALPALLDIHGGGFVLGSAEMNDVQNRDLALELGCLVIAIEYRLAPETPFPGALEDCYAVLLWLRDHALEYGVDPARIALLGTSAGGGLAAGLALMARDWGKVPLAGQILLSPMLDDRTCGRDANPQTGAFGWSRADNHFGWQSLLGTEPGETTTSIYAAPSRCETLEGLPPTFISVGSLDLFFDEDIDYARRLQRSGVPTELHVYPGAFHGFARFAPEASVSRASVADFKKALRGIWDIKA